MWRERYSKRGSIKGWPRSDGPPESDLPRTVLNELAPLIGVCLNHTGDADDGSVTDLNGNPMEEATTYNVPCSVKDQAGNISSGFDDEDAAPLISIAFSDLIVPMTDDDDVRMSYADGSPMRRLSICATDKPEALLGVNFLKSAYVVHHLDEMVLRIAQAADKKTRPATVVEIRPGDEMWTLSR